MKNSRKSQIESEILQEDIQGIGLSAELSGGQEFVLYYLGDHMPSFMTCKGVSGSVAALYPTNSSRVRYEYFGRKSNLRGTSASHVKAFMKLIEIFMNDNYSAWNW